MVKSNVRLAREWNATYVVIFGQWIVLLFRIKWVKMPEAMLSVSAKLIRMLNLAYWMSLFDSSFGPEGQKRELLDLRKRASARGTQQQLFPVKCVRRSKYYLEFSITWGRLKSSRWPFHFCRIFEAYLITEIPFELNKFNFSHFTP